MASLLDPALRASMLRSGAGQGLMSLGAGLMAHGAGGGPQAIQRGIEGIGQAMDPMRLYQAQMIQNQLQQQADERARQEQFQKDVSMLGQGGQQPMLGGSLVDMPGGGTEPGQGQTAMIAPTQSGPMLPPEVLSLVGSMDYRQGAPLLAKMLYQPPTPQKPTTLQQNLQAAGVDLSTPQGQQTMLNILSKPSTQVNLPKQITETESMLRAIEENRALFSETGEDRYKRTADRLEMQMAFGGKPPESYIKARQSIGSAREGISEVYDLISSGEADPTSLEDRAKVSQSLNKARLAYADLLNRGANFTESEQAMIDAQLGGNPNDIINRTVRGDRSYLEGLQRAAEALERRGAGLLESYTTPGISEFTYSWERTQPQVQAPSTEAPTATNPETGERLILRDGKWEPM